MGMELPATPHLGTFYKTPEDYSRSCRAKLEHVVQLLPAIAMGDAFQHWIYTHPRYSRAERSLEWLRLFNDDGYPPTNVVKGSRLSVVSWSECVG